MRGMHKSHMFVYVLESALLVAHFLQYNIYTYVSWVIGSIPNPDGHLPPPPRSPPYSLHIVYHCICHTQMMYPEYLHICSTVHTDLRVPSLPPSGTPQPPSKPSDILPHTAASGPPPRLHLHLVAAEALGVLLLLRAAAPPSCCGLVGDEHGQARACKVHECEEERCP